MAKGRQKPHRHTPGKTAAQGDALGHEPYNPRTAAAAARPPRAHNDPAGRGSQDNSRREQGSERRTHR